MAAVLAGLFPALRASSLDPIQALKSAGPNSSAGRGDRRLLRGVTVIQTALTLALLVGAGLLIRTMRNIAQAPSGYDTGRILTMSVTMVQGDWSEFHRRALERVSAIAGVQSAAFAWGVPLTGNNWPVPVDIEGRPAASKASDQLTLPLRSVTPGYFNLLGLTILDGRDFRSTDARKRAQYYWVIKEHSDVELFCGITPLRARPTRETLRGIYKGPGERRGACRPARTLDELLQGIVVTR